MIQEEEAGIPVPLFLGNGKTLGLISGADNCCRSSYGQEELEQQAQLADRVGYLIHAFKRKKIVTFGCSQEIKRKSSTE